jgi:two-component system, LytTR family, response regulator
MIKCVIIEDDRLARESLLRTIEVHFATDMEVVGYAETLKAGVELINQAAPDLVFLDIELPDETGLRLFDYIQQATFEVVFTTSNNRYALDALRFSAIDYLIKPISNVDLRATLIRYEKRKQRKLSEQQIKMLIDSQRMGKSFREKVALPTNDGFQVINSNEIVCCLASENYTYIQTIYGNRFLATKTLKAIEEMMPGDMFFRIHKSTLLNMNYVRSFSRKDGSCEVTLENGDKYDVATRRQEDFTNVFVKKQAFLLNKETESLFPN